MKILCLCFTALVVLFLALDYIKNRDWEGLSILGIKTTIFTLIMIVLECC